MAPEPGEDEERNEDDADEDEPALPLLGSPSSSPGAAAVSADKRSKPKLPCGKCGGTSYNKCTPIWNQHCRVPKRATRPESAGAGGSSSRNRRKNTATTTIDHGQSARAGVGGGPKKKKRPPAGTFGPPDYSEPVGASSSDDSTALYADANPLVYKSLSSGLTRYDMRWIGDCCSDRCADRCTNGSSDDRTNGCAHRCTDRRAYRSTHCCADGCTDRTTSTENSNVEGTGRKKRRQAGGERDSRLSAQLNYASPVEIVTFTLEPLSHLTGECDLPAVS